jgi:hypothetical protein
MRKTWQLFVIVGILVVALVGFAWAQKSAQVDTNLLLESDFQKLQADTVEKKDNLKAMPQKKLFTASQKGKRLYLCADTETNVLFVGDENCYKKYCALAADKKCPPEQTKIHKDYGENFDWLMWNNRYGP